MDISVDKEAGTVRVDISANLTAEEIQKLLSVLAKAHGELTQCTTQDDKTPLFPAFNADIRPLQSGHVQFSLLTLIGWCQFQATPAQANLLAADLKTALLGSSDKVLQ